jgi:hypothetical protein
VRAGEDFSDTRVHQRVIATVGFGNEPDADTATAAARYVTRHAKDTADRLLLLEALGISEWADTEKGQAA